MIKIDLNKIKKQLGKGGYGLVYEYGEDEQWVIKRIVTQKDEVLISHIQEIVLGFSFDHPNVLPIKSYQITKDGDLWRIDMMMPRMKCTLWEKYQNRLNHNEMTIVKDIYAIAKGISYLHEKTIAHRDIKPTNILIDENGEPCVADVGIAKFISDHHSENITEIIGTNRFIAPELLDQSYGSKKKDLYKADAWSLGKTFEEILTLDKKANINLSVDIGVLAKEGKYSESLIDLVRCLLKIDPSERITIQDVLRILPTNYKDLLEPTTQHYETQIEKFCQTEKLEEQEEKQKNKDIVFTDKIKTSDMERIDSNKKNVSGLLLKLMIEPLLVRILMLIILYQIVKTILYFALKIRI